MWREFGDGLLISGLPHLHGVSDLEITERAGGPVLYTISALDGGMSVFQVSATDTVLIDSLAYTAQTGTLGGSALALGRIGSAEILVPAGRYDDNLGLFRVAADGSIEDGTAGSSSLIEHAEHVAIAEADGTPYLLASERGQPGVEVFEVTATLDLRRVAPIDTAMGQALGTPSAVAQSARGEAALVYVASSDRDAVFSFEMAADGTVTEVGGLEAGADFPVSDPTVLEPVSVGGNDFLLVGGFGSGSLSVLGVDAAGQLSLADHVIDSQTTRFAGVSALETVQLGDHMFVFATGNDDGITAFQLAGDGRLIDLGSIEDTPDRALDNLSALAGVAMDGEIRVFATGVDPGISTLAFDPGDLGLNLTGTAGDDTLAGGVEPDLIAGGDGHDLLSGGAGDDRIIDGNGFDILFGGAGADVFYFNADGDLDVVQDFQPGEDRLDLTDWPVVGGLEDLTLYDTDDGVVLTAGDEILWLAGPVTSGSLTAGDFDF